MKRGLQAAELMALVIQARRAMREFDAAMERITKFFDDA